MTDREPHAPPTALPAPRPTAADSAPADSAHAGNGSLMSAMIATRPLVRHPHADPGDRGRAWLARLFAGDFPFPAVPAGPLPPGDRTAPEHAAAARAAGCRDLFVVHADPVAGEKLIVDVVRATSDRALVLSPNPAAADRVAERLLKCGVSVLRALAEDENPLRPSSLVSKATSAAVSAARTEQLRREAAFAVTAAEQRLAAFGVVAKAVARLAEVNGLLKGLEAEIAEHTARRDRVEQDVRGETGTPFANGLAKLKTDHDGAASLLAAELQTAATEHKEKFAALAHAKQQHAEAARKPGLLARLFGGKPKPAAPDAVELEKQVHVLEAEVAAIAGRVTELQARLDAAAAAFTADREKLVAAEVASRRAGSEAALTAAVDSQSRAQTEVAALNAVIAAAVPGDDHAAAERQLAAARERAVEVARLGPEQAALAEPRVVVGIPGCVETDPVFSLLADDPPFGLLVLDRAEELPEAEFPRLARLAGRWVLVGETIARDDPPRPPLNGTARPSRNGRPAEVPFAARLAKLLDRETWAIEGDRLVCRLAHLTPEQRRGLTREPLADRPEIELRFTAADGPPLLAEIVFPGSTTITAARSFLFHELGEVLLRPCGDHTWEHAADAITARWPVADGPDGVWIDLEPGVREKISGTGLFGFTAAVSFDPAAGWDAEKAAAWLANRLQPSASRFTMLPRTPGPRV